MSYLRTLLAFILLLSFGCGKSSSSSDAWDDSILDDLKHQMDLHGLGVMRDILERREASQENVKDEPNTEPSYYEINSASQADAPRHRVRRSDVIIETVKSAQKTGNREELQIRSSVPFTSSPYLFGSSHILPLELEHNISEGDTTLCPLYFAVAKLKNKTGTYDSAVYIVKMNRTTGEFALHLALPEIAPYKMAFHIGFVSPTEKKTFFAVTGFNDGDPAYPTTVSVYLVEKGPEFNFIKFQSVPHSNVAALEFLEMHKATYLIIALQFQSTSGKRLYSSANQINVLLFDQSNSYFYVHSSLPGSGVSDIAAFTTETKAYIVAANYQDDRGNLDILSFVYEFNELRNNFHQIAYLSTHGARDVEHFVLAKDHYIVIANEAKGYVNDKDLNVYSNVYKVDSGKFTLLQSLETYGATLWKSLAVPNCKQDVLLLYADQRDSIDQVGMYSFSHDENSFRVAQFSIYQLDRVSDTYRARPSSIATFALQDYYTDYYNLYVVIGANSTSNEGSSIYKISYDVTLTDSPLNAFKRLVTDELQKINDTLADVKQLLGQAERLLDDAVTYTGERTIAGEKTIQELILDKANIEKLHIAEGSILYQQSENATTYRANRELVEQVLLEDLERNSTSQNTTVYFVYNSRNRIMLVDTQQVVTVPLTFNDADLESVLTDNVTVQTTLNDINLNDLFSSIVKKNESTIVASQKLFRTSPQFQSLYVKGKINDLTFDLGNIVVNGVDQVITGTKTISENLAINGNLNAQKLDGVDVKVDLVLLNQPATISGKKTFMKSLTTQNATIQSMMNGISLNTFKDIFSKSKVQTITGFKSFKGVKSMDNVVIETLVNGHDLKTLKLQSKSTGSIIYGNKIFTSNVAIVEALDVDQTINELNVPKDVLLKNQVSTLLGRQTFTEKVTILKDIKVAGTIDGRKTTDMVTLDGNQIIYGVKTFLDNVMVKQNLQVDENKTINNIDLSEFVKNIVTLDTDQKLSNFTFQNLVTMHGSSTSHINGDPVSTYQKLYQNSLHINGDQDIPEFIKISNSVNVNGDFAPDTVNGYRVPENFAQTTGNQTFIGRVTFANTAKFVNVSVGGSINGINMKQFDDLVFKDSNVTITSAKNFFGDVTINGDLITNSTINGIDFSTELLFLKKDQNVTGVKHFNIVNAFNQQINILSDLAVNHTIDGVDLSELNLSGMTVTRNETITGSQCFQQTDYNRSVSYINNIDLSALRDDIVTINTDQTIRAQKTFEDVHFKQDIVTTSTVNDVDVSELEESVVFKSKKTTITGNIIVKNNVKIMGDLHTNLIDNVNITNLENVLVSKSKNESMENMVVHGKVIAKNVDNVETINGLSVENDFVYRSKNQTIEGEKVFSNITANHVSSGNVNGVDLTVLESSVVYKDTDQIINGPKIFKDELTIEANLTVNKLVNDMDVNNWPYIRTSGIDSQTVVGTKHFNSSISFGTIKVANINGQNISKLFQTAVRIDRDAQIQGPVVFKNGVNVNSLNFTGNDMTLTGFVNGIDVKELDGSSLKITGDQDIKSATFHGGHLEVNRLTVNGTLDGYRIPEDVVTKHTEQEISGIKTFEHITLNRSAIVGGKVDGVNITELAENSLLKTKTGVQTLTGNITFASDVAMGAVSVDGTVGGRVFSEDAFVTLHTEQNITGILRFTNNFHATHLTVKDTINGINLAHFNDTRVSKITDSTITGDVIFDGNLRVDGNVLTDKYINGIDLSEYNVQSPLLDDQLDAIEKSLNSTLLRQCASLTFIATSLLETGYRLDSFSIHQQIPHRQVVHSEYFTIGTDSYLALTMTGRFYTHCTDSVVMKWDASVKKFVDHQYIPTASGKQMRFFRTPWDEEAYLFVVNSLDGCSNVYGSCQMYHWNTTGGRFELKANKTVNRPTHIEIFTASSTTPQLIYIFVSSVNSTLQAWTFGKTGLLPYTTGTLSNPQLSNVVYSFSFNGDAKYVVVGMRTSRNSSRGFANVYRLNGGVLDLVQSLQTRGVSSITSFVVNEVLYLTLANDKEVSENGHSTYEVSVEVYAMTERSMSFAWFQSIPTHRVVHVTVHEYGKHTLLAVTHFDQSVSIHRFAYELGFLKEDEIFTPGVSSSLFFRLNGTLYLTVNANDKIAAKKPSSVVLKVNPTGVNRELAQLVKICAPAP